jgi:HEAT repeat protein
MRCRALEGLANSSHPSDTERIFASLRDQSPLVRCAAVRALGKANKAGAQSSLVRALQDPSFQVREVAARTLGQLRALSAAHDLAAALRDPDAAVRIAAAGALRALGWKPSTQEELAWFEIALGNTPAAVPSGNAAAVDPAIEPIQDTSFYRRVVAEDLREKSDPRRINALLSALHGNNSLARVSAIHDLGQVNEPRVTQELLNLFRDQDPQVRLTAAQVLAERVDSPPAHFLSLLQDSSDEVRVAAVQFLGRIRHQQMVQVLCPLLTDPSLPVRQAAASALGCIGDHSAIEPLVAGLSDENDQMRQTVAAALEQIDPAWINSDAAFNAASRLETP